MTRQQETQPKLGSRDCLTVGAASAMLELRRTSGCEFTTCTTKAQLPQDGATPPPVNRPQGGLAVAVIRAHPEQDCIPSSPLMPGLVKTVQVDTKVRVPLPGRRRDTDSGDGWAKDLRTG